MSALVVLLILLALSLVPIGVVLHLGRRWARRRVRARQLPDQFD